jgi:hypothetical protein
VAFMQNVGRETMSYVAFTARMGFGGGLNHRHLLSHLY